MKQKEIRRPAAALTAALLTVALILLLACSTAATPEPTAPPTPQPETATAVSAGAEEPEAEPAGSGTATTAASAATEEPEAEPAGDETPEQKQTREASIAASQTVTAQYPIPDTSNMHRLSADESACLRERSPQGGFSRLRHALEERDLETTKMLHSCLTSETAVVLLLMNQAGVPPELSENTWSCINEQMKMVNDLDALAAKHGMEPTATQELDRFTLMAAPSIAMLMCVTDEEFEANRDRLGEDSASREALRCVAEATGGLSAMLEASMSQDPQTTATYEEQVAHCTPSEDAPTS